jgi:BirA family biotin operon repressor/biotin-[acetyl-CoA-carboxylase] ligase
MFSLLGKIDQENLCKMYAPIYFHEELDGVIWETERLLSKNHEPPFAVRANKMTSAKGRFGKRWHSESTDNLHLSIALPNLNLYNFTLLSMWSGIEVCKTLNQIIEGLNFELKWPNDIYCNGKKVSGMQSQSACREEVCTKIIFSIGLNINTNLDDFPEIYKDIATSLKIESNKKYDMGFITEKIVQSIIKSWEQSQNPLNNLQKEYDNLDYLKNKKIIYPINGSSLGIDEKGFLKIKSNKDGEIHMFHNSDIILDNEKKLAEILNKTGCNFYINFE